MECSHGVARWERDCGATRGGAGLNQQWRGHASAVCSRWHAATKASTSSNGSASGLCATLARGTNYIDVVLDTFRRDRRRRFGQAVRREPASNNCGTNRLHTRPGTAGMQRQACPCTPPAGWSSTTSSGTKRAGHPVRGTGDPGSPRRSPAAVSSSSLSSASLPKEHLAGHGDARQIRT